MIKILNIINSHVLGFSIKERIFILTAMMSTFCICAEYAVIRPVSNSVFIHAYTSQFFPIAWLATIPLNLLIISLYNRYLSRWGIWRMFLTLGLTVIGNSLFCALLLKELSGLPFLFYLWKDIYIMLMLQQVWSVINATIDMKRAKYLYGLIFGVGGLGSVFGSFISGFFAVKMGSENLLFFTLPLYTLLLTIFYFMLKHGGEECHAIKTKIKPDFWEGTRLIIKSKYLLFILSLVIFMQFSTTILDYQFHHYLERTILDKDLRTQFSGRTMGLINIITVILQFCGTFLLVHFLGLRLSHFIIPCLLCLNAITFLLFPVFGMITFSFITIKAFDFSLFGVIREMLYIPLSITEKFRAKAIIEIFAYRSSKSLASLFILFLQWIATSHILSILTWGSLLLFLGWGVLVAFFFKQALVINKESI